MKYMISTSDDRVGPFTLVADSDDKAVERSRELMRLGESRRAGCSTGFGYRRLIGYRIHRCGGEVLYTGCIATLESGTICEVEAFEGILKEIEGLDWVAMPKFQDRPHLYVLVDMWGVVRGSISPSETHIARQGFVENLQRGEYSSAGESENRPVSLYGVFAQVSERDMGTSWNLVGYCLLARAKRDDGEFERGAFDATDMIAWFYYGNRKWQKMERFIETACFERVEQLGRQSYRRPDIISPVGGVVSILRDEGLLPARFPEKVGEMDRSQVLKLATILLVSEGGVPEKIDAATVRSRAGSLADRLRDMADCVEVAAGYVGQTRN